MGVSHRENGLRIEQRGFHVVDERTLGNTWQGAGLLPLPAAIGAWAAVGDDRPVVAVTGDGGLCQYLAEFTTLVKYRMPIKLIVLNNNELGKISKEQRAGGWEKWSTDLVNPDFAEFARSSGGLGIQVEQQEELDSALQRLFSHQGPGLLEIKADERLI